MGSKNLFSGDRIYLLDGAMGSMLQNKGLPPGSPPETMTLEDPLIVEEIHQAYLEAGADLIETNTFGGNRAALSRHGLEDKIIKINSQGAEVALRAASSHGMVAGSLGPTGELLAPLGRLEPDAAEEIYYEQCHILKEAGLQLVNIETMNDLAELKSAVIAARTCQLAVMAEATIMENGYTLSGASPEVIIATLEGLGVTVAGLNCGLGPVELKPLITRMAKATSLPLIVQPNAGLPQILDEETVYPLSDSEFSQQMQTLMEEAQPQIVGGCCGTNPEHIKRLRKVIDAMPTGFPPRTTQDQEQVLIAGRAKVVWWKGDWDDHISIHIQPHDRKTISFNGQTTDFFSLIETVKKEKIAILRLDFDAWESKPNEVKGFIQDLQLYYTGPCSVRGDNLEVFTEFFRYYLGKPIYEGDQAHLPPAVQKCIDKYLPGTIYHPLLR